MATKYWKDSTETLFQKIGYNTETTVSYMPITNTYCIQHYQWHSKEAEKSPTVNTPITAREFQEAYLRAKTALDEIVSAE